MNRKAIKLIAIDLDGTLFDSNKQVSPANREALKDAVDHGIRIVICTGRTLQGVQSLIPQLPKAEEAGEEFIIVNNGVSIYGLPELKLLAQHWLADDLKAQILDYSQTYAEQGLQITTFDSDHYYLVGNHHPSQEVDLESRLLDMPVVQLSGQDFLSQPVFKVVYLGEPDLLDEFVGNMPEALRDSGQWIRSFDHLLECLPDQINKGYALAELIEHLNIHPKEVMAIGDERNDREMLELAGYKVAMGNAHPDIKELADYITGTHEESGVAQAIQDVLKDVNE